MQEQQFSRTALITAAIRAYHATHDRSVIFEDVMAPRLLADGKSQTHPGTFLTALQDLEPDFVKSYFGQDGSLPWWLRVIAGAVLSRARYVEDCLAAACSRGVRQYVILGAGLDTFAFRNPDLMRHLQVFEVDHPGSQAFARRVFAEAGLEVPESLHFLPADLEKERLSDVFRGSTYDRGKLTFFSLMGVTYYLACEKVYALLGDIVKCAPPGSAVVFDYLDCGFFAPDNPHRSVHAVLDNVRRVGEPMLTGFDPRVVAGALPRLGFHLPEDLYAADIEARYFRESPNGYHAGNHIHFVLAEIT
jgi:methyltransferase (TIGR00027 family)